MTTTALVEFITSPEQTEELLSLLARAQSGVIRSGCKQIALFESHSEPGRVVELEVWDNADDHRAMMSAARDAGAFDAIDALLTGPTRISYLRLKKEKMAG